MNNFEFQEVNMGLNKLFKPLKLSKIDINDLSYNTSLAIYFLNEINCQINIFKKLNYFNLKHKEHLKMIVLLSADKIQSYKSELKFKHYNITKEEQLNIKEIFAIALQIIILFILIIKEVIL